MKKLARVSGGVTKQIPTETQIAKWVERLQKAVNVIRMGPGQPRLRTKRTRYQQLAQTIATGIRKILQNVWNGPNLAAALPDPDVYAAADHPSDLVNYKKSHQQDRLIDKFIASLNAFQKV
ncbi:AAEL004796-PA [Aedes aegypti]|uniref:AAEL004796-PA n=1 Tax=Aedes aegypti TaxID=7159 RepID=Q17BW6_AEDAE|nr:AAEL004796-PA [Aedes aegypti]